ncbi:MAG: molybdopterin molybdotransferase MoeA [Bacteroidetes bacterium]|nr:molybdopterin molybdotransferase MoeA [Bacteroidota bacterium]
MISYADALRIVLENAIRRMPEETVPLVLAADRVLARPVVAADDVPAQANSAMDGYAVRAADVAGAQVGLPRKLRVIGEAAAGTVYTGTVGEGEAVRIMTGAVIPAGADAVVEVEVTDEADEIVEIRREVRQGESIRQAGEDVRAGATVIEPGKNLHSGDIGLLAAVGMVNVPVRVTPKVAILSTGNEIVEAFRAPGPGQVRNSTGPALYAACARAGAEPIDLGIARDASGEIEEKLEEGLRYDILLTTGGVSAGLYDLVQTLLPAMGVEILFHRVNIRPGRPILFGRYGDAANRTLVFGLPGNPVSTLVTFEQFVMPAIASMLGRSDRPRRVRATLAGPIRKNDSKRHFLRGVLQTSPDGTLTVSATGQQSSGAISSMSLANCLIVLDEQTGSLDAGSPVNVELLY